MREVFERTRMELDWRDSVEDRAVRGRSGIVRAAVQGAAQSLSFALVAASNPSYIRLKREAPSKRQNRGALLVAREQPYKSERMDEEITAVLRPF